jgi:hypothetical protein
MSARSGSLPVWAPKHNRPPDPPMTLGNMRELGVRHAFQFASTPNPGSAARTGAFRLFND